MAREYTDNWAIDISKNVVSDGVVYNEEAINQSIESILATYFGERIFRLDFGSSLGRTLFNSLNESTGEELLSSIINSIKRFERRIRIVEDQARLILDSENNAIYLLLYYIINERQITSQFEKKIYL